MGEIIASAYRERTVGDRDSTYTQRLHEGSITQTRLGIGQRVLVSAGVETG